MFPTHLIGILSAVTSAIVWGSGDFLGGLATRRSRPFTVTAVMSFSGLVFLLVIVVLRREPFPNLTGIAWALAAGACGALGIAALYLGLATANAGQVAPIAAVVGAGVTLLVGSLLEGPPGGLQSIGLLIGLAGIWLVSRGESAAQPDPDADQHAAAVPDGRRTRAGLTGNTLVLAVTAGLLFGAFFVLIAQVERGLVFSPLVLAKSSEMLLALAAARVQRDPPALLWNDRIALLAGVLDAGGNIFYPLARQYTRLDIAAILASMYPASTVLLSVWLLRQPLDRGQVFGLLMCLCALALIAA